MGALGIPLHGVPFGSERYRWHDTRISKIVDYAYHAIAVDERRAEYAPAVWNGRKPAETIELEQRWFVGAHANVGGGYRKRPPDALARITLRWMQDKAERAGLMLRAKARAAADDALGEINDSHAEFVRGLYQWLRRPVDREIGVGVNETIDASVWTRWKQDERYRPGTLRGHAPRAPVAEERQYHPWA